MGGGGGGGGGGKVGGYRNLVDLSTIQDTARCGVIKNHRRRRRPLTADVTQTVKVHPTRTLFSIMFSLVVA